MPRKRILVADDEEGIRESLNLILGDAHDLVFSHDGQEALDRLRNERFDLALLDVKMPKLDGLEVLKQLQGRSPATPILMLTAYQSVELAKEAIKLGASDYLPKPFERERILAAVNELLAR
jgi:DNA-binding NtrC family response regulator